MLQFSGKLADPGFRRERASKAARASLSLPAHVRAIVARAPELTSEQREQLATALVQGASS